MIKFSVMLPHLEYSKILKTAREAEKLGYTNIWYSDHLLERIGSMPYHFEKQISDESHSLYEIYSKPLLENWTVLSALASETKNIRLGSFTLCYAFRYPSVLAKMTTSLDNISNGRLTVGIGAGYFDTEFKMYGIPFEKFRVRMAQLRETLEILKKMWTEKEATYQGKYYSIKDAVCEPKPIQKPHPPIFLGGRSSRLLKMAGEFADIWNWPPAHPTTPENIQEKSNIIKESAIVAGRSPESVEISLGQHCLLGRSKKEVDDKISRYKPEVFPTANYMGHFIGTPEEVVEKLQRYVSAGVTHFTMRFQDLMVDASMESMRMFAEEVIPELI